MSYIASRSGPGEATAESLFGRSDPHFQQRLHQVGEVRFVAKAFLLYGVFLQENAFLDIGWIASFAGWRR
jgi:hypothetical protein